MPTLRAFAPRFIDQHARAERQKPSGIRSKEVVLRVHLIPRLGHKPLDAITSEDVQSLKSCLLNKAPKTVNNVLTVLSMLLKKAVEWNVIDRVPCTVKLVKVPERKTDFHDFESYERLVEAALATSQAAYLVVLLGGEAGLRSGEIRALESTDVDLHNRQLCVSRSDWKGQVNSTKGGRVRHVPLTTRLEEALRRARHMKGPLVVCHAKGEAFTEKEVQNTVARAMRRAGLERGGVHTLRHTFCSHLAMKGAPARAVQELAGHQNLSTTQRYMHLSPATLHAAIRLLDDRSGVEVFGEMVETAGSENSSR